jgi:hypothetical protein
LPLLVLDDKASAAADAHCKEMSEHSFISHWSLNGDSPYQRFGKAGVVGFVCENIAGMDSDVPGSAEGRMLASQGSFIEEIAPSDSNKRNTLAAGNTHVGIGVHCMEQRFRYAEVYLGRQVELDNPPTELEGTAITLTGKVMDSAQHTPHALKVFYTSSDGVTAGYPDCLEGREVAETPLQHMTVLADGIVRIPVCIPIMAPAPTTFSCT